MMQMNLESSIFMGCDVCHYSISISCRTSDRTENCYSIECWPMFFGNEVDGTFTTFDRIAKKC